MNPLVDQAREAARRGKLPEAASLYQQALRINPKNIAVWVLLSKTWMRLERWGEVAGAARSALLLNPLQVDANLCLAMALNQTGFYEESNQRLKIILDQDPTHALAYKTRGANYDALNQFDLALKDFDSAIQYKSEYALAHLFKAITLLRLQRFEEGFLEYEWRLKLPETKNLVFPSPLWDGKPLRQARLLLLTEQGLGDTVQFIRYAPWALERVGKVLLSCQPSLIPLMKGVAGVNECFSRDDEVPPHDVCLPLMSLPYVLRDRGYAIPSSDSYLNPEMGLLDEWKNRLSSFVGLKIGLCWKGNPNNINDHNRSIHNTQVLKPFSLIPGVHLFSLQKESEGVPPWINPLISQNTHDIAQLAAAMKGLDLIISVDTLIAHLAGSLGKRTLLLLSTVSDWRWFTQREDSPFYPSVRLMRQARFNDWEELVSRVVNFLKRWEEA